MPQISTMLRQVRLDRAPKAGAIPIVRCDSLVVGCEDRHDALGGAHPERLPDERPRSRVEALAESDMTIGMQARFLPDHEFGRLCRQRQERRLLDLREHFVRSLMRRAVLAHPRDVARPSCELRTEFVDVALVASGEEVALDVLHARLDLALRGLGKPVPPELAEKGENLAVSRKSSSLPATAQCVMQVWRRPWNVNGIWLSSSRVGSGRVSLARMRSARVRSAAPPFPSPRGTSSSGRSRASLPSARASSRRASSSEMSTSSIADGVRVNRDDTLGRGRLRPPHSNLVMVGVDVARVKPL